MPSTSILPHLQPALHARATAAPSGRCAQFNTLVLVKRLMGQIRSFSCLTACACPQWRNEQLGGVTEESASMFRRSHRPYRTISAQSRVFALNLKEFSCVYYLFLRSGSNKERQSVINCQNTSPGCAAAPACGLTHGHRHGYAPCRTLSTLTRTACPPTTGHQATLPMYITPWRAPQQTVASFAPPFSDAYSLVTASLDKPCESRRVGSS